MDAFGRTVDLVMRVQGPLSSSIKYKCKMSLTASRIIRAHLAGLLNLAVVRLVVIARDLMASCPFQVQLQLLLSSASSKLILLFIIPYKTPPQLLRSQALPQLLFRLLGLQL